MAEYADGPYRRAICDWPGCRRSTYAVPELWDAYVGPAGSSTVKETKEPGRWACFGHAYAVGGGWRS